MPRTPFDDDEEDGPRSDRPMTLGQHLDELRRRVFRCVLYACAGGGVALWFEDQLYGVVLKPYLDVLQTIPGGAFQLTEPAEGFLAQMWLDIAVGLFLASPFILLEMWGFIAKGLYEREKRAVRVFAPISLVLFVGGAAFYYFVVQPGTLGFLLRQAIDFPILGTDEKGQVLVHLRIETTLRFYLVMSLVMGLTFEFPLLMIFAQRIGFATWRTYLRYWRHFLLGSTVVMAILTPSPDAATLIACMIPVLFLFAGGIVACWLLKRDVPKEDEA